MLKLKSEVVTSPFLQYTINRQSIPSNIIKTSLNCDMDSRWYRKAVPRKSTEIDAMGLLSSQIKQCPDELIGLRVSKEMV